MAFLVAQCVYCERHRPVTELQYDIPGEGGVREMSCRDTRECDLFMDGAPDEVLSDLIEARMAYGVCVALAMFVMFVVMQVRF